MLKIAEWEKYSFVLLEEWEEVDRLKFAEFNFFKELGIIDYKRSFKAWLRKFPRPTILVCIHEKKVIGWIFIEEGEMSPAEDGNDVFILRAIEINRDFRGKNIGKLLVHMGLYSCYGHILTKPLTKKAREFFTSFGFNEITDTELKKVKINNPKHHMILKISKRDKIVKETKKIFSKIDINGGE